MDSTIQAGLKKLCQLLENDVQKVQAFINRTRSNPLALVLLEGLIPDLKNIVTALQSIPDEDFTLFVNWVKGVEENL